MSKRSGELALTTANTRASRRSASLRAEQDVGHLQRVARRLAGDHRAHVRLVGQRLDGEQHVEVARVERPVVRLAAQAAGRVQLLERLRQPAEPLEVGQRRLAPLGRRRGRTAAPGWARRTCGGRRRAPCGPGCGRPGRTRTGAFATCSSTNSGSKWTTWPSTRWPGPRGTARRRRRAGTRRRSRRSAAASPRSMRRHRVLGQQLVVGDALLEHARQGISAVPVWAGAITGIRRCSHERQRRSHARADHWNRRGHPQSGRAGRPARGRRRARPAGQGGRERRRAGLRARAGRPPEDGDEEITRTMPTSTWTPRARASSTTRRSTPTSRAPT